jgi:hypothetical protein
MYLLKHILNAGDVRDIVKRDFLSKVKPGQKDIAKVESRRSD